MTHSYNSRVIYSYEGNSTFTVPFDFIKREFIKVKVNDVETTNFTFLNDTQITINDSLVSGDEIVIYRDTNITNKLVNFTDLNILNGEIQNLAQEQVLDSVQELYDNNKIFQINTDEQVTEALTTSNEALENSNTALNNAEYAVNTANTASEQANNAVNTANTADTNASIALENSNTALETANTSSAKVDSFETSITSVVEAADKINQLEEAINRVDDTVAEAEAAQNAANEAMTAAQNAANEAMTAAQNAEESLSTIGDVSTLSTNAKDTIVNAINEVNNKDTLPDQDGNSGKYLTTNGSEASWGNIGTNIKSIGADPENDTLYYIDTNGVKHEYINNYGGIAPMPVKHKEIKKVENGYELTWTDPDDSVYQNNVYCTWGNTVIVRKIGSYPESAFDGEVVLNSTIRNQHSETPYLDEVDTTQDWYYRAFPCSINRVYSQDDFNKFGMWVYSYTRLRREQDPSKKIVYRGVNEHYKSARMSFTSGKFELGDWEDAPFLLKDRLAPCAVGFDGELKYFLNPNNYKQKEDGTSSDNYNTNSSVNFYMRIKLLYVRRKKNAAGDTEVDISNIKVNDDFKPYGSFIKPDGTLREYIYLPIYQGSLVNGKCRSIAGQVNMNGQTAPNERNYCIANGAGHDMITISDRQIIEDIALLMLKHTNTQEVLGQGYIAKTGASGTATTAGWCIKGGTMDEDGLFFGSSGNNRGVKFLGIENIYANQWWRCLGEVLVNGVRKVKLCQGTSDGSTVADFNFTGDGYITLSELPVMSGTSGGYISDSQTVDDIGTFPIVISGSATTGECDGMWFNNSGTMVVLRGGASSNGALCGLFCSALSDPASHAYWAIGSAVSYKPL